MCCSQKVDYLEQSIILKYDLIAINSKYNKEHFPVFSDSYPEAYLEPSRKSTIELLCESN